MTNPGFAHGQSDDAEGVQLHVDAIRSQVRRDLRATSFPLLAGIVARFRENQGQ